MACRPRTETIATITAASAVIVLGHILIGNGDLDVTLIDEALDFEDSAEMRFVEVAR